ncbi:MAG: DNA recombination protein RmuC [Phycisphaerae bacterium]|nr:DNA recombination protein RmuC [Phycisphaerae bacterium]
MTTVLGIVAGALALVVMVLLWDRGRLQRQAAGSKSLEAELERRRTEHERDLGMARQMADNFRAESEERRIELTRATEQAAADRRAFADREQRLQDEQTRLQNWIREREVELKDSFEALSTKTLDASAKRFVEMAQARFEAHRKEAEAELEKRREALDRLVKPIGETLDQTKEKLEAIEKARVEHFAKIGEQLTAVTSASASLREETGRLTSALSRPEVRGQYGEIQLRRVAELAGMTSYCDFSEQATSRDSEGAALRPDMIVQLPNARVIAVDAKTNTYAYLEAVNARDAEERERHMERFAKHVADQAKKLAAKKYWAAWDGSPEFTVMFVPGDHFIDAALSRRPDLLDTAAGHGVILASPSTLIGLLRAVAVGWREQTLADEARELFELGRELHERAAVAFGHISQLGDSLRQATERYNRAVGSIDSRLVPTLRKFEEAGAKSSKDLKELPEVEVVAKSAPALEAPKVESDGQGM